MWYHHGMTGFGWVLMGVGTLVFWALLIGVVVLLVRALGQRHETGHEDGGAAQPPQTGGPSAPGASTAERLLAERFARGEIDEHEYRRRLAVLRDASGRNTPG